MDTRILLKLLQLLHVEAQAAYWNSAGCHCGGDFAGDCDDDCSHYHLCKTEAEINALLKELEAN